MGDRACGDCDHVNVKVVLTTEMHQQQNLFLIRSFFQKALHQIKMSDVGDFQLESPRSKYIVHASGISEKVRVGPEYQADIPNSLTVYPG